MDNKSSRQRRARGSQILMWRLLFAVWLSVGGSMENALAEDYVDAGGRLTFELNIFRDVSKSKTGARMTFEENGLVELRKGGFVTVNGVPLKGHIKTKPGYLGLFQVGYDYFAELPNAEKYEVVFKRSANHEELRYVIPARDFFPYLPKVIHVNKDLIISFDGPPIVENETIYATAQYVDRSPPNWGGEFQLLLTAHGNKLTLPASLMRGARKEMAELVVSIITTNDAVVAPNKITYAINMRAPVEIID